MARERLSEAGKACTSFVLCTHPRFANQAFHSRSGTSVFTKFLSEGILTFPRGRVTEARLTRYPWNKARSKAPRQTVRVTEVGCILPSTHELWLCWLAQGGLHTACRLKFRPSRFSVAGSLISPGQGVMSFGAIIVQGDGTLKVSNRVRMPAKVL